MLWPEYSSITPGSEYCDERVCVCVFICLFACPTLCVDIFVGLGLRASYGRGRSFSGGVVMRYVLLV